MVALIVLTVVVPYFVMTYNRVVSVRNNVEKAWSNINLLLKQVGAASEYHDVAALGQAESMLRAGLGPFFIFLS